MSDQISKKPVETRMIQGQLFEDSLDISEIWRMIDYISDSDHLALVEVETKREVASIERTWQDIQAKGWRYFTAFAVFTAWVTAGEAPGNPLLFVTLLAGLFGVYCALRGLENKTLGLSGAKTILARTDAFRGGEEEVASFRYRLWTLKAHWEQLVLFQRVANVKSEWMLWADRSFTIAAVALIAAAVCAAIAANQEFDHVGEQSAAEERDAPAPASAP